METRYESFSHLFPMRMTSIEKFHWFDDNKEYPNVVFCRMRVAGALDEELASKAWQIAVQRQPFADVEPRKVGGTWKWVQGPRGESDSSQSFKDWNGTRFEWQQFEKKPSDWEFHDHPTQSPTGSYLGVFSWPSEPSDQAGDEKITSEIWLYVHHAVGDGAGSILVINDWMIIYANLVSNRDPEKGLHRLDPKLLETRNSIGFFSWRYLQHIWKQPIALFGAAKFTLRKTAELIPGGRSNQNKNGDQTKTSTGTHYPSIIGQWMDASQVERLNEHAKSNDVMMNTVLLGQLYLALIDWRKKRNFHEQKDWMRIILPISIRNVSDRRLPTANRATIVQVDRRESETGDLRKFYSGINYEIMVIRGWQLDKIFILAIRAMSLFEPLLKRAANSEKSRGMAVFTNLGEPLRKSERASSRERDSDAPIRPIEFDFVGPIRKGTPVNFAVSRYGAAMRVSLQYDHRLIAPTEANELLSSYVDRLKLFAVA